MPFGQGSQNQHVELIRAVGCFVHQRCFAPWDNLNSKPCRASVRFASCALHHPVARQRLVKRKRRIIFRGLSIGEAHRKNASTGFPRQLGLNDAST
jgi:hypothetical protein